MRNSSRIGGAMIAMALTFAAVGILFGLGRLATYKYQVTRRINRQYQVEKMLTTRSALSLVKYECTQLNFYEPSEGYLGLVYKSINSDEALVCDIIPTRDVDRQEMDRDFTGSYTTISTEEEGIGVTPDVDGLEDVMKFVVSAPVSNKIYRCAVFKKAERYWLENEFGYLYRLRMQSGSTEKGFNKLRLYLLGAESYAGQDFITENNYLTKTGHMPSPNTAPFIMMELSSLQAGTTNLPIRKLGVHGGGNGSVRYLFDGYPYLNGADQNADSTTHGGGFLLSGTKAVGFGESGLGDLYFSGAVDLNQQGINIANFSNSWVVIEHEFAINMTNRLEVTLDVFTMREPTTYSISVNNSVSSPSTATNLMTWVFQTRYPQPDSLKIELKTGKQCILDTFGFEPYSLGKERRVY